MCVTNLSTKGTRPIILLHYLPGFLSYYCYDIDPATFNNQKNLVMAISAENLFRLARIQPREKGRGRERESKSKSKSKRKGKGEGELLTQICFHQCYPPSYKIILFQRNHGIRMGLFSVTEIIALNTYLA